MPRGTGHFRILIFPPQSDKVAREFSIPIRPTSLAFARQDRLFYGMNGGHDEFFVREVNVASGERVRSIDLRPSWFASSVATDDHNVLYVNTKSLVGGDVKLFQPGDLKPYLEIKDPLTPLKIYVAHHSLWVGYSGVLADGLARYDVRSTKQTWFRNTGSNLPAGFAVNPGGSLIATHVRRNNRSAVIVYDTKRHGSTQIHEGDTRGLASDDSGNLYIAQKSGRILVCTFTGCPLSFETNLDIEGLAWNPRDGMLYVPAISSRGNGVYVYNPRTTSQVRYLPVAGNEHPSLISIEA
ncbi:MAG: hypothetical protein WB609_02075 [Candidatus Cybelea sp.]